MLLIYFLLFFSVRVAPNFRWQICGPISTSWSRTVCKLSFLLYLSFDPSLASAHSTLMDVTLVPTWVVSNATIGDCDVQSALNNVDVAWCLCLGTDIECDRCSRTDRTFDWSPSLWGNLQCDCCELIERHNFSGRCRNCFDRIFGIFALKRGRFRLWSNRIIGRWPAYTGEPSWGHA